MKTTVLLCLILHVTMSYADDSAMYPFGDSAGDTAVPDRSIKNFVQHLAIPQHGIVFLGQRQRQLELASHGTFYFSHKQYGVKYPLEISAIDSSPFFAPLYFDLRWLNTPEGNVYYRLLHMESQNPSLNDLSKTIQNGVVGASSFNASNGFIATWINLTDSEDSRRCGDTPAVCKDIRRNTFQAALVFDVNQTFVIFNYAKVTEAPGKRLAGFYAGDSLRWTPVLPSDERSIGDLEHVHGTHDVTGRFLFKVSGDKVVRGGCFPQMTKGPLMTSPTSAGMYGGEIIELSGPCISPSSVIYCRFADTTVMGRRISYNKAVCTVPILKQRGRIEVALSITSPPDFRYIKDDFTILLPGRLGSGVTLVTMDDKQPWNEINPSSLTLRWDSQKLSEDPTATVEVNLFGYREDDTTAYWTQLTTIAGDVANSEGRDLGLTVDPTEFRCSGEQCSQFEVGVVQVKLARGHANTHSALFSYNLPLGWFVTDYMTSEHGAEWPSVLCTRWDEQDSQDTTWIVELPNCPCTMNQAMADFGRWQPDVGCNIFTGSRCTYHKGAVHCVRSVVPTESGAGNQCCYTADGNLKYAADSFQGSTPDRGHAWGAVPYVKPGFVPEESHWVYDVVTFYYCCLWVEYRDCDKYMTRRPTRDCVNYEPAGTATAFGDPHISTFDGLMYRFQGNRGEYTLMEAGTLRVQGQFKNVTQTYSNFNVSLLSAIAIQDNSDVVVVQIAPENDALGRRLDVMVNGESQDFTTDQTYWQDYRGVSITNVKGNHRQDNVTVLLQSGVGVQVADNGRFLNVIVSAPPQYKSGETRGLFGVWDGNKLNDFSPRGRSSPVALESTPEEIYLSFASTWAVEPEDLLFGRSVKPEKEIPPTFDRPERLGVDPPPDIASVCSDSPECRYDYMVSGDRGVARSTLAAAKWYQTMREFLQPEPSGVYLLLPPSASGFMVNKHSQPWLDHLVGSADSVIKSHGCECSFTMNPSASGGNYNSNNGICIHFVVDTCGLLNVPYAEKDNTNYHVDSSVTVTGCRLGFRLEGETTYACTADSGWQPEVTAKCIDPSVEDAGLGKKIGIGLGVVGGVALIVIIAVIIVKCQRRKSADTKSSDATEMRPEPKVPARSEYLPAKTRDDAEDPGPPIVKPRGGRRAEREKTEESV